MMTSLDLEKMLKEVSVELKDWKVLMEDLAGAFYTAFPATRRYGWTLHLRKCAASKGCDMCPHSISWVRYYYVKLSKEKKDEMKKAGQEPPNSVLSWDNTSSGKVMDGLPTRLKLTKADKRAYRQYEAVRSEIMFQHRALSHLRKRLLARVRNVGKDIVLPVKFFGDGVLRDYYMAMMPVRPIKIAVIREIQELQKGLL